MFGKKKEVKPSRRSGQSLSQYGLFDMPDNMDDLGDGSDEGDSDLEAELAAISGGGGRKRPKPRAKPAPVVDLDSLVAESMRDIPSDEEMSDGEDDPDILNELSELASEDEAPPPVESEPPKASRPAPPPPDATGGGDMVTLLQERIQMYSVAEENAKSSGETSRARRFNRGLKTLKDLLKQAKAGKKVNEEEIPPPVSTAKHEPPPSGDQPPAAPVEVQPDPAPVAAELSEETKAKIQLLTERKDQYKIAALSAKKAGDGETALAHMKMFKQFDLVMEAVKAGHPVDLSDMPGPPGEAALIPPAREDDHTQQSAEETPAPAQDEDAPEEALITASSAEEALQQRLEVYQKQEAAAQEAGNTSKARRMGRIVKQYQQAIKSHAAGRAIPFDELPTPPGYAPIPGAPAPPKEEPAPPPAQPKPAQGDGKPGKLSEAGRTNSLRKMGNQMVTTHAEKQLAVLLQRQKEFRECAINAKKKGEMAEAKEYLRIVKGLDPLIDAARGGLPVDLTTIPLPPQAKVQLEESYDMIAAEDCNPDDDSSDLISRLEEQLTSQLKLCMETRDHHKALGDVAGMNRFEHLALNVKQDLDVVKMAKRLKTHSLKFHYENKQFSIVQCCTDLGDNDLELTIVRGISYTVDNPKDIDTYVKFEFPYPQEEPVRDKTALVKDTNSPEYNAVFPIPINRSARPCVRVFKRQAIKLEVYSRRCCGRPCSCPLSFFSGFFSRDSVIGTVTVKLQPLETQTVLHDSFDLMDGRKAVGGKLEVKIRVRHPLLAKQIEQTNQKWLHIDH